MRINTLFGTKEVITEQGGSMELKYYLVQDIREEYESDPGAVTYGIGIIKNERGEEEREWIPGISDSFSRTRHLLYQMMEGLVTPMTAVVVVDDMVEMI